MLDSVVTAAIKPTVNQVARWLKAAGLSANQLTVAGFAVGAGAALSIALGYPLLGLALILLSRMFDALDGAVARLSAATDRGGFLDITLDFVFYASIPLAFAVAEPAKNALPAAVLLAAFMGTSSSFLAYAAIAAKRGDIDKAKEQKSLVFLGGLTEATETLICFCLMCLLPLYFAWLAYGFAAMCVFTAGTRILLGWRAFRD
jgi:phosphatidylglycerophosphate synthase